jgi:hypothetical protein
MWMSTIHTTRFLAWTRKAYSRKEDRSILVEFLQRLDTCSLDLNVRIAMHVQKSVSELKQDAENIARLPASCFSSDTLF